MTKSSLVYNRSDLQSEFPEADGAWIRSLEADLLKYSDRILYVSRELMRVDEPYASGRQFFLDHGVDLDRFGGDDTIDPEILAIPRPRAGFFGGIDDYVVDISLLRQAAERLSNVHFVLIGDATCDMADLTELANVHWLGYRPYDKIPSLGRGFDVALMPWLDNSWIRFANPIKLKEYLALGLPVVTTEYPEVEAVRDLVHVAGNSDEFSSLIESALQNPGDPYERRCHVEKFSWSSRARLLVAVFDSVGR